MTCTTPGCAIEYDVDDAEAEGIGTGSRYAACLSFATEVVIVEGGGKPSLEVIQLKQVLTIVQLHSGVLNHAAARKLDLAGWRLQEQSAPAVRPPPEEVEPVGAMISAEILQVTCR